MANQGSVSYQFQRAGEIVALKGDKSPDDILSSAMENNVSDYEEDGDSVYLYTDPSNLQTAREGIEKDGFRIEDASLVYKPSSRVNAGNNEEKIVSLIEKLEDLDDVQKVYTNCDFSL